MTLPFLSTVKTLSPSPSKAKPISPLLDLTISDSFSIWVEPTFSLMFLPFGSSPIKTKLSEIILNIYFPDFIAAPFEKSNAIFKLDLTIISLNKLE